MTEPALAAGLRAVHVLAVAAVAGGALPLALVPASPRTARAYEVLFWMAAGLLLLTGVANLGALGQALPGAQTRWGRLLVAKLLLLLLGVVVSLVRTLVVLRVPSGTPLPPILRAAYAATALGASTGLVLGVTMAHA